MDEPRFPRLRRRLQQLLLFHAAPELVRAPEPAPGVRRRREEPGARRAEPRAQGRSRSALAERAALRAGVAELRAFVRESGGAHIGTPRVRGRRITVSLVARDGETYHLRIDVDRYLDVPPSCDFVDAEGRATARAWPSNEVGGPFRSPRFICTPPTAEFYQMHLERRYRRGDGTLVNAVATVFAALRAPEYGGRFDPAHPIRRRR
jgi:hypothetical protein